MNMTKKEIILLMNNDGNQPDCFFKIHNLQSCGTFLTKTSVVEQSLMVVKQSRNNGIRTIRLLSGAETTEFEPHGC